MDRIDVCTSYRINGDEVDQVPYDMTNTDIDPVLRSFDGWPELSQADIENGYIPENLDRYISFLEKEL